MTRDEIKNKIQLTTTNVNKKKLQIREEGLNRKKKKQLKGWFAFRHGLHANPKRKRRKKKEKSFPTKPRQTIIHAPYREKRTLR
jgi:hypothetical protein